MVDVGEALALSYVVGLHGRPYPVQFRHQGSLDAWSRALAGTPVWARWSEPQTTCWAIRHELLKEFEHMDPLDDASPDEAMRVKADRQLLAVQISANMKYYLNQGTVIETTPALEVLLTNSDIDLSLPMSMVAPPYPALYLRFGEATMRSLKVPSSPTADRFFDGVFCFFTPPSDRGPTGPNTWTLEFIFISKREDRYGGHVTLLGETDRGETTVGRWLDEVLDAIDREPEGDYRQPMHAAVGYVVKVFLYMALKRARIIERHDYDAAMRRVAGLGERKRVRLLHRAASLYNAIVVGPEALPADQAQSTAAGAVAPHWRRGHFRMQAFGPGWHERKLIFVAPVLIHADKLNGELPAPRTYRAHAHPTTTEAQNC